MTKLYFFLSLSVIFTLLVFFKSNDGKKSYRDNPTFNIKRGLNISHYLSQTERNAMERNNFINEGDIKKIAELGFDHIRLPLDEKNMWNDESLKNEQAFEDMHKMIQWCEKHGLKIIIDLHIVRSHYFNGEENSLWSNTKEQKKFIELWADLSSELIEYPNDLVAYELLNEPVAPTAKDWNHLLNLGIKSIRKEEPYRYIIIGSNKWNSVSTINNLKVPEDDKNLILSFHFYSPHTFTHYKAPWSKKVGFYKGPIQYPGKPIKDEDLAGYTKNEIKKLKSDNVEYSKKYMAAKIKEALIFSHNTGIKLHCGEFGAYPTTPEKDRLKWYKDLIEIFEENNIAWTKWDYKGGFGIFDKESQQPDEKLIEVLIKK